MARGAQENTRFPYVSLARQPLRTESSQFGDETPRPAPAPPSSTATRPPARQCEERTATLRLGSRPPGSAGGEPRADNGAHHRAQQHGHQQQATRAQQRQRQREHSNGNASNSPQQRGRPGRTGRFFYCVCSHQKNVGTDSPSVTRILERLPPRSPVPRYFVNRRWNKGGYNSFCLTGCKSLDL